MFSSDVRAQHSWQILSCTSLNRTLLKIFNYVDLNKGVSVIFGRCSSNRLQCPNFVQCAFNLSQQSKTLWLSASVFLNLLTQWPSVYLTQIETYVRGDAH